MRLLARRVGHPFVAEGYAEILSIAERTKLSLCKWSTFSVFPMQNTVDYSITAELCCTRITGWGMTKRAAIYVRVSTDAPNKPPLTYRVSVTAGRW